MTNVCLTLQYFWPALSDNWSWKPIFGLVVVAVLHRFYSIVYTMYHTLTVKYLFQGNKKRFERKIVTVSLLINVNVCFWFSKESSLRNDSFEYTQHMF